VTTRDLSRSDALINKPLPEDLLVRHGNSAESRWDTVWDGVRDRSDTPTDRFFVRNHTATPVIDASTWTLKLYGSALRGSPNPEAPIELGYRDLLTLPRTTTRILMECTGNGRTLFATQQGEPAPGTPWGLGAVGTATWTGVPLRILLERAGVTETAVSVMPIGLDADFVEDGINHGPVRRPLPIAKAMDDVLVAYEMNGSALLPDHGFPARLVVPNWVGVASIKWLGAIEVADRELFSPWNTTYYRMNDQPLTELIPKSVLELGWDARLAAGTTHILRGRAWSGSAQITSVEISVDDGRTWQSAELVDDGPWTRWSFGWRPRHRGARTVLTRATDAAGNRQPDRTTANPRGYLFGAVVRHPVTII
jgi:DMSO/TMAO reductase YedYZ molybdopterin-dependent catalytic subunit